MRHPKPTVISSHAFPKVPDYKFSTEIKPQPVKDSEATIVNILYLKHKFH